MSLRARQTLSVIKQAVKQRVKSFGLYDPAKTESAIAWLSRSKPGVYVLNTLVVGVLSSVSLLKSLKSKLTSRGGIKKAVKNEPLDSPIHSVKQTPRVLLIVENAIPQCFHYRVQQKIDLLEANGNSVEWFAWSECSAKQQRIHYADIVIFYRVPGLPLVMDAIAYAKQLGKVVVFDVDDLVFDRAIMQAKLDQDSDSLSAKQKKNLHKGADLYRTAIEACDYGIASTESLRIELAKVVAKREAFLLPNGLDQIIEAAANQPFPEKLADRITVFYASGTKTHDADFALIEEPITRLMKENPNVHLLVVGHLNLPTSLSELGELGKRVDQLDVMPFAALMQVLRQADIAIAPLVNDTFADCKSAIKWLEAAAVKVPCVVSDTQEYRAVIKHEKDGYIAKDKDDWYNYLDVLVNDANKRTSIADSAYQSAQNNFGVEAQKDNFQSVITAIQDQAVKDEVLLQAPAKGKIKKRLLLVNTLYPPHALGGATKVVKNIADELVKNHPDYEVSVLTAEVVSSGAYSLREYRLDGVNVTVLKVPYRHDLESLAIDEKIEMVCGEWFKLNAPDIIHFHSMQHLTASPLVAAKKLEIPYVVTVHDAWWISEHQFMLDRDDQLVDEKQLNPIVAAKTASNASATITRSFQLAELLHKAKSILGVSKYQQAFYQRNGFNVDLNLNGVDAPENVRIRHNVEMGKLKIAYLGGKSAHKGYDLLRSVFEDNHFPNLSLQVADLFKEANHLEKLDWGNNTVELIGKQPMSKIADFYATVDVLVAPSIWPESFGLVTREATLHGLWVVAAEAGGLAEDIKVGENGFSFPMGDADKLTQILNDLNDGCRHYRDNKPNRFDVRDQITSVEQQVKELVSYY